METLVLTEKLLSGLNAEGIAYCHWKSTTHLAASLSGETDLDLLVSADRREQCLALLDKLNFWQARAPGELLLPEIFHYFGFDQPSGRLVHVHLYFYLIIGDDLLKNYRLPVEEVFIASARLVNGIAVPAPEVEFITFVLRMTLKRRLLSILVRVFFLMDNPLLLVKQLLGIAPRSLTRKAQSEFDDLSGKISEKKLTQVLSTGFPFVPQDLFQQCRLSLLGKSHRFAWVGAGKRLARTLAGYRRVTGFAVPGKMLWQAFSLRIRAVLSRTGFPCSTKKSPVFGGLIIAFVGSDGAGKTTLTNDTAQWLGRYFSVRTMHLGKPGKGLLWFVVLTAMKIGALFPGKGNDSFHQAVRYWLVAYYRYRTYRQAIRLCRQGTVVLADRVPLPDSRYMDAPRIAYLAEGRGGLWHLMASMEEQWHQRIKADELIVLRVDPEIVAQRRPEDDPEILAKRCNEIWNRHWTALNAHVVDASRPLEEVVLKVRSEVWKAFSRESKVPEQCLPRNGRRGIRGRSRDTCR